MPLDKDGIVRRQYIPRYYDGSKDKRANPRGFISGRTLLEWARYGCLTCVVFIAVCAVIMLLKAMGYLP